MTNIRYVWAILPNMAHMAIYGRFEEHPIVSAMIFTKTKITRLQKFQKIFYVHWLKFEFLEQCGAFACVVQLCGTVSSVRR